MSKWFILATSCLAFTAASAQETASEPITSTEEVSVDRGQGSGDASLPPSFTKKNDKGCGCGGKPK